MECWPSNVYTFNKNIKQCNLILGFALKRDVFKVSKKNGNFRKVRQTYIIIK